MKRILLHLVVSLLAFVLGVTVSVLWRFQISVNLPEPGLAYIPVSLKIATLGNGLEATTYLSNGEQVARKCQNFTSATEANSVLHARHHSGADVIEWFSIIDGYGQPIGQTILILENSSVIRLSTYREKLCETRAPTLNEMRWFDNWTR